MSDPAGQGKPPAVSILSSRPIRQLIVLEAVAAFGGVVGYLLTKNLLAYAPLAVAAALLAVALFRFAKASGAGATTAKPPPADPLVR